MPDPQDRDLDRQNAIWELEDKKEQTLHQWQDELYAKELKKKTEKEHIKMLENLLKEKPDRLKLARKHYKRGISCYFMVRNWNNKALWECKYEY